MLSPTPYPPIARGQESTFSPTRNKGQEVGDSRPDYCGLYTQHNMAVVPVPVPVPVPVVFVIFVGLIQDQGTGMRLCYPGTTTLTPLLP